MLVSPSCPWNRSKRFGLLEVIRDFVGMLLYFVLLLFDCFHCWVSLFCFQILRRDRYDKSCDMWSLGVVMYILYVRYFLFAIFLFFLSLREILKWLRRGFIYEFWKEIQKFTKSIGVSSYYEDRNEIYSELGFFVWILAFFFCIAREWRWLTLKSLCFSAVSWNLITLRVTVSSDEALTAFPRWKFSHISFQVFEGFLHADAFIMSLRI